MSICGGVHGGGVVVVRGGGDDGGSLGRSLLFSHLGGFILRYDFFRLHFFWQELSHLIIMFN